MMYGVAYTTVLDVEGQATADHGIVFISGRMASTIDAFACRSMMEQPEGVPFVYTLYHLSPAVLFWEALKQLELWEVLSQLQGTTPRWSSLRQLEPSFLEAD